MIRNQSCSTGRAALHLPANWQYRSAMIVATLCFVFTGCVSETQNQPSTERTLGLGVNNWVCWRSHHNGEFSGVDVDVWNEIAKRNQLSLEYVFIPNLKHLRPAMEDGSIDVFVSMRPTPEREEYMDFIEPPFRTKLKFITYVKGDSNTVIDRYQHMDGKTIAMAGGSYARIDNDPNITKVECGWNPNKAFKKLIAGTVDAVHINHGLAIWFLRGGRHQGQLRLTQYTCSEYHPCYMVMSKTSTFSRKWKSRFGQTIQDMIDGGTMEQIIDTHIPGWYESIEKPIETSQGAR